jgi:hypothetical protein
MLAIIPFFFSASLDEKALMKETTNEMINEDKVDKENIVKEIERKQNNEQSKKNKVMEFVSPDQQVQFTILNPDDYPYEDLVALKRDLRSAFDDIKLEVGMSDYSKLRTDIVVTLKAYMGEAYTESGANFINLYNYDTDEGEWLHYALVQAIFSTYEHNWLLNEGLAIYHEYYYGYANIHSPAAGVVISLQNKDEAIPLHELLAYDRYQEFDYADYINEETLFEFDTNEYWFIMIQLYSFMIYFIDTNGIDTYIEVLATTEKNIIKSLERASGKSIKQLETDWINYLEPIYEDETYEDM